MDQLGSKNIQLTFLRELIDTELQNAVPLPPPGKQRQRVQAAMRYALLAPGKRLRPLLTLLSAHHLGCPASTALPAACALELVHAASLVLDDLPCMDNAEIRRGQPCVHVQFGEDIAVLTGVALLNQAYSLVARAPNLTDAARREMTELLTQAVGPDGLIGGQDKDLLGIAELTPSDASQLHHEKTGVLFVAAVEMGALAAGADAASREALRTFALELGLAFQAMDDLEDSHELQQEKSANLAILLGVDGLRGEAARRLARAKQALDNGPTLLAPIGGYVDLLLGRMAA